MEAERNYSLAKINSALWRAGLQGQLQLPWQHDRHQFLQLGRGTHIDVYHEGKEWSTHGRRYQDKLVNDAIEDV